MHVYVIITVCIISEYLSTPQDHTSVSLSKSEENLSLCIISLIDYLMLKFVFFCECNINLGAVERL